MNPLLTPLDTRSRPSDLPPGWVRWKQNFQYTADGKFGRAGGFQKFYHDASPFTNHDFHRQGGTREPVTFQFESTFSDGTRRYYVGTQSGVWLLNPATGVYDHILASGFGDAGTRWRAAELQDYILFTNNHDAVQWYSPKLNSGVSFGPEAVPTLGQLNVTKAFVIIQWNGFMIVANVEQDGQRQASRILWSDINNPNGFNQALPDSLAGFQDLDYGDDILAAAPLLNNLYFFTRRSIWKMSIASDQTSVFAFTRVYNEPKNQTGCIALPNTLTSDGQNLRYAGRDGFYVFNPYLPAPEREEWLHRANGLIYRDGLYKLDAAYCLSPVAEFRPDSRELWFSWPTVREQGVNNWTLVAQVEQKTAHIVDHGFTSFANFRRTPGGIQQCNEVQDFLGASGEDYCIKSIGGVLLREFAVLTGLVTEDLPDLATYYNDGYYSILRGMIPLGLTDRDKIVRSVLVDHDTAEELAPCVLQLRLGNSFSLVDANDTDGTCSPVWQQLADRLLQCPNGKTSAQMLADNLRPNVGTEWKVYVQGRFLYFELKIANQDGTAAIGGDTFFSRIDFDAMAMVKP